MDHQPLDIVIPVHNAPEYLDQCLKTLFLYTPLNLINHIFLVDDDSDTATKLLLDKYRNNPLFSVMTMPNRSWFTRTANAGLKATSTSKVLLLNSDLEFMKPEGKSWLEEMLEVMRESDANLVGSWFWETLGWSDGKTRWVYKEPPEYATGHCWLLTRRCFETVGFLDETQAKNIHFNSDVAYCHALVDSGLKVVVSYLAPVHHHDHKSLNLEDVELSHRLTFQDLMGDTTPVKIAIDA